VEFVSSIDQSYISSVRIKNKDDDQPQLIQLTYQMDVWDGGGTTKTQVMLTVVVLI